MGLTGIELGLIGRLQKVASRGPIPVAAHALSTFGEHSAGWLVVAATGVVVDSRRRSNWIGVGAAAVVAHACAVVVKCIVRRSRPDEDAVQVLDTTPSRLSFPSAHAASTTAAAVVMAPIVGKTVSIVLPMVMGLGRVVLGVHYPTDVVAGSALGALVGGATLRFAHWYAR